MRNKYSKDFTDLIGLCAELAQHVDQLVGKVLNLENIARYQENQINTLQDEVLRLNGIVDNW